MKKLTKNSVITAIDGTEFRKARRANGRTLREISSRCKISISYLCDIELGRRTAKGEMAKKLLAALVEYVK